MSLPLEPREPLHFEGNMNKVLDSLTRVENSFYGVLNKAIPILREVPTTDTDPDVVDEGASTLDRELAHVARRLDTLGDLIIGFNSRM